MVLSVANLSKAYGGVQAVRDVSFSVAPGEMVAIIGPNGAGKTTCFNMLNGQLAPDSGEIRLGDTSLVGLPPHRISRLGVGRTFQITATFPTMTVRENVQVALVSYGRQLFNLWRSTARYARDEAGRLLDLVGIPDLFPQMVLWLRSALPGARRGRGRRERAPLCRGPARWGRSSAGVTDGPESECPGRQDSVEASLFDYRPFVRSV